MNPRKRASARIAARGNDQKGATLVEYSLLLLLIAFVLFLIVQGIGESTKNKYSTFNSQFGNAANK